MDRSKFIKCLSIGGLTIPVFRWLGGSEKEPDLAEVEKGKVTIPKGTAVENLQTQLRALSDKELHELYEASSEKLVLVSVKDGKITHHNKAYFDRYKKENHWLK